MCDSMYSAPPSCPDGVLYRTISGRLSQEGGATRLLTALPRVILSLLGDDLRIVMATSSPTRVTSCPFTWKQMTEKELLLVNLYGNLHKCTDVCICAYCDEPVSCPESSIWLGWVVQYFLYVVAVVQLASSNGEPKASTPGLCQKHWQFKLFNQSLTDKKQS